MKKNNQRVDLVNKESGADVSRRQMLRVGAIAAGGAVIFCSLGSPADAKMTFQGAGYQPTPKEGQTCAGCSLFQSPSSCVLVDGNISPNGWCRFYRKKN